MTSNTLEKIQSYVTELTVKDEIGNKHSTGLHTVPMDYIELKPTDEEDRKRLFKQHGLTYEPPEVRAIRDAEAIARMKRNGQIQ